jgi:hypothetical protein
VLEPPRRAPTMPRRHVWARASYWLTVAGSAAHPEARRAPFFWRKGPNPTVRLHFRPLFGLGYAIRTTMRLGCAIRTTVGLG